MEIILFLVVVVADIVSDPAVRDPAPTASVCIYPVEGLIMVISPETVNVLLPEIETFALELVALVYEIVAQAAAAVTVTVTPLSMKTSSPATGKDAPEEPPDVADQVPVEFQLPVATEYRLAPCTSPIPVNKNKSIPTMSKTAGADVLIMD